MIPQTLSHYRVLEKIGAGGMGVVYRAHDEQLDRDVALKVLPPGTLSDEKARQRFRREALALAKLNHPNVGAVYEFGSEAGVDFLVMELVSGVTLDTKLTGGPLQEQEVLRLGAQLADGLDAAHTQGIIHRDLKPGNLRLTSDGRLKILDFGLAQWTQEEDAATVTATLTKGSDVSGTVPYMAPELLRGHLADARTDVYAAGAVLYELATGKRPFPDVTGPQLIGAILERQPSALTSRNHRISPALESIVLKALDKDPNRRYQSARELRVDLERLSTGVVPVIRRGRPPWVWAVPAVIAAALLIALAANVGGWRDRWFKHSPPTSSSVGGKTRRSVAVLGFKNLSGRPEAAWISTAIAEMLTTELAAGEQLRTVPGENVARMKQDLALSDADSLAPDTLARIHRHLGSDLVILGSYLALGKENGGKLRLDFRLQDAVAGETIATVSETATESELIDLVSRTGAELRSKLGVGEVSPDEASGVLAALPSNPDAARLYSEGLDKLRVFETLAGRDLLAAAVAKEPDFAPAHSALSGAWSALGYDARAQDEAKKAFDLSQGLPRESRLAVEGRYRDAIHDWPKAVEIYNTLFGFFPDNLEYGLRLATAQVSAGKGKEAMATLTALHGLPAPEGDDPRIDLAESKAANSLGDFKQAQESAAKAAGKGRARGSKLLVAQARAAEGGALERLGKSDQATAALTEAQTQFSEAGDKLGAALAVHTAGNVMYDQGNFAGARKNYLQAYEVFRQLGTQSRASSSLNNLGNVCYELGDLECARQYYQQTLDTDREIEDKSGAAGALGNLGNVLDGMGRLAESRKMQEAGLEAFRAIGDKRGTASTLTNFGNLLVEIGDLEGARAKYEEAIQIQTETGHKRGQAYALYGLANVLTAQANLQEARKRAGQCASIRHETGEQSNAAASDTQLANIALEEGRAAEAVALTRPAAQQFEKDKVSQNAASAYALLALALLAENKTEEARQSADRAVSMAQQTVDKAPRFEAAIAKARVDATSDPGAALKLLEATRAEAAKFGYVPYELEARLAMGEIEMKSGKAAGRSRLDALEKDAKAKGYLLVAQKAAKGRG